MSYLVDSDWLIDAFIGVSPAVNLLARMRSEGLAVSIISYGELFEGALGLQIPLSRWRDFAAFSNGSLYSLSMTPLWKSLPAFAPIYVARASSSPISIC